MKQTLKNKVVGLALISALMPVAIMVILICIGKMKVARVVLSELDTLIKDSSSRIAHDVYGLCEMAHVVISEQVLHNLNVARSLVQRGGNLQVDSSATVSWTATNQFSLASMDTSLPKISIGNVWLGQNRDAATPTPLVDEVTDLVGGTCTIFQRINPEGDMLRIATNVLTLEGERAIGTFIPAEHPDGTGNSVIAAVLRGDTYVGRAFVVNAWYLTAYEPIRDSVGNITGMLYVGVKQEAIESLRKTIMEVKVGRTGYVWVLGGKGKHRGQYIISQKGKRDGESVWDDRDDDGKHFVRTMVERAIAAHAEKPGTIIDERYPWRNPGEQRPRMKTASATYFAPWDWVIGAGLYEDDYLDVHQNISAHLSGLLWQSLVGGLALLVLSVIMAMILGGRIAEPITRITNVAKEVARGNLSAASKMAGGALAEAAPGDLSSGNVTVLLEQHRTRDETGQLHAAVQAMTRNLHSLVRQVKQSSVQVMSTATQIAATSKQQERVAYNFGTSTNEVVASVKEISATSEELTATMGEVKDIAAATATLADAGRKDLMDMERTMRRLGDATTAISSRLSVINDKATNINTVVATIGKVADQTNLLSLNAAIEAEKAGEYGLGFGVVAQEIRGLADQTALATLDIEQTVKEMGTAVSAGVMEMDKFTEEVTRGVSHIGGIVGQLTTIIEQVQTLTPRFENLHAGMQAQSEGGRQITTAMVDLSEGARNMTNSLREFNNATQQLKDAVQGLQAEVSRFSVSG